MKLWSGRIHAGWMVAVLHRIALALKTLGSYREEAQEFESLAGTFFSKQATGTSGEGSPGFLYQVASELCLKGMGCILAVYTSQTKQAQGKSAASVEDHS